MEVINTYPDMEVYPSGTTDGSKPLIINTPSTGTSIGDFVTIAPSSWTTSSFEGSSSLDISSTLSSMTKLLKPLTKEIESLKETIKSLEQRISDLEDQKFDLE
jgi:hypothetical protein